MIIAGFVLLILLLLTGIAVIWASILLGEIDPMDLPGPKKNYGFQGDARSEKARQIHNDGGKGSRNTAA